MDFALNNPYGQHRNVCLLLSLHSSIVKGTFAHEQKDRTKSNLVPQCLGLLTPAIS